MNRRRNDLSSVFWTVDESLTLWRRIFLIGCVQHDMIALCEPVIILYGHIPVTLAAWSLSFSSAACIILVEWMIILLMEHQVVTLHSLLLVRAMVLRHRAISDPSLTAVSHHLPTMSRQQHPRSDFGRSPLRVRVTSTSWLRMRRRRPMPS